MYRPVCFGRQVCLCFRKYGSVYHEKAGNGARLGGRSINGKFKLTEEFIGTIDYNGTLEGNSLVLYNDDPEKPVTCMYVFEKE